jgi:putative Mg2+ transporter-C (MgtC) family protein
MFMQWEQWWRWIVPYLGNLHTRWPADPAIAALILIACSMLAGLIVGSERESKNKPAGLRTVSLISVGSTIFTLASVYAGNMFQADGSRIAAQIVTGVGFLGAGAIIRERGQVIGLTTGATIWTMAAIGVLIGLGYGVAGLALSVFVVALLTLTQYIERAMVAPCRFQQIRVTYDPDHGKTSLRLRRLLDRYRVSPDASSFSEEAGTGILEVRYCTVHPEHRTFLGKLAEMSRVREIREVNASRTDPSSASIGEPQRGKDGLENKAR